MADPVGDYQPFNIKVMDVDDFIQEVGARPVTSLAIHTPSSTEFHPDGLFSEEIFGMIGSEERLKTAFGYIELNTVILAPVIYRHLVKLSAFYEDIMAGKSYAIFDDKTLVYFNDEDNLIGFANYNARAEAKHFLENYNYLWSKRSKPDPDLRVLSL